MNILYAFIYFVSKAPLSILYIISDVFYFITYYIIGYRKKIVYDNLKNSFPNKSDEELKAIQKKFFKNFTDYIMETVKGFSISTHELLVRVQHINRHLFDEALKEEKNIILLSGHVFNWEWATPLAELVPQENCYPVYRKMQNKFWEKKIKALRNRHGNTSIEANDVIRHIFKNENDGNSVYMFVADQSPDGHSINYGLDFMNQKTPVFVGYDKIATRKDYIFINCEMKKVKRGYYQINYSRIYPDGEKFTHLEVVQKFNKLLDNTINKHPDNYLWSHRRWKYANRIKTFIS